MSNLSLELIKIGFDQMFVFLRMNVELIGKQLYKWQKLLNKTHFQKKIDGMFVFEN